MSNFEILIVLVLFVVFLSGCGTERLFIDNDRAEMLAFFDKSNSLVELIPNMQLEGFHYANEINDLNYYTDLPPAPEKTYERKWANCYGFAIFITEFLKYKGCFDNIKMISLRQRGVAGAVTAWHYIILVQVGQTLYEVSNMQLRTINNIAQSQMEWASMGYSEFEAISSINK